MLMLVFCQTAGEHALPYCGVLVRAEISDTNRLNKVIRKAAL